MQPVNRTINIAIDSKKDGFTLKIKGRMECPVMASPRVFLKEDETYITMHASFSSNSTLAPKSCETSLTSLQSLLNWLRRCSELEAFSTIQCQNLLQKKLSQG